MVRKFAVAHISEIDKKILKILLEPSGKLSSVDLEKKLGIPPVPCSGGADTWNKSSWSSGMSSNWSARASGVSTSSSIPGAELQIHRARIAEARRGGVCR